MWDSIQSPQGLLFTLAAASPVTAWCDFISMHLTQVTCSCTREGSPSTYTDLSRWSFTRVKEELCLLVVMLNGTHTESFYLEFLPRLFMVTFNMRFRQQQFSMWHFEFMSKLNNQLNSSRIPLVGLTAACLCVFDRIPWIFTFCLSIWSIFTHKSLLMGSVGVYVLDV